MTDRAFNFRLFLIVSSFLFVHVLALLLPAVNLEFAFSEATHYFVSGDQHSLNVYFAYQANTLGIPLLAYGIHTLFPFINTTIAPRVGSVFGIVLLSYSAANIGKSLNLKNADRLLLILLLLSNPLIWIFSGRGTADFLPTGLGVLGLSVLLRSNRTRFRISAALIIGLSIFLKYHAFVYALIGFIYLCIVEDWPSNQRLKVLVQFCIFTMLLPACYIMFIKLRFGFFLTPPKYQTIHGFESEAWLPNFFSYALYVVLILLPFSLEAIFTLFRSRRAFDLLVLIVVAGLFILIGMAIPGTGGEMNFGPLDRFIPPTFIPLLSGVGPILVGLLFIAFYQDSINHENSRFVLSVLLGILIFLTVLSTTRPAQRYLILVIPFFYFLFFASNLYRPSKYITIFSVVCFLCLNAYAAIYQYVVGTAANEMADKIQSMGLANHTRLGAIEGHVGGRFFGRFSGDVHYMVVQGDRDNALLKVEKKVGPYVKRVYSLVSL
jgi:hypothetical protein